MLTRCTGRVFFVRSIARHVSTLRNFYRFLLEQGATADDPASLLTLPKQWSNLPKFLNADEIARLLAAPAPSRPTGLRDLAMLEFLYATGLRVSELCKVSVTGVELNLGFVRVTGKGNKQRIVPVGKAAITAVEEYLRTGRPSLLGQGKVQPVSIRYCARGGPLTRQAFCRGVHTSRPLAQRASAPSRSTASERTCPPW